MCFFFLISKALKFKSYTETKLFAQFDKDIQLVKKVSFKFSTGNAFKPKYKLRVLRLRLTHLEGKKRYADSYNLNYLTHRFYFPLDLK